MFRASGVKLVFWDCYRPHEVQVEMFEAVPDPNWVARPGTSARSHESGRSVDVTLADAHSGLIDMGTDFDDFSPGAMAFATDGVTAEQQANRAWLRDGDERRRTDRVLGRVVALRRPRRRRRPADPRRPAELTVRRLSCSRAVRRCLPRRHGQPSRRMRCRCDSSRSNPAR